MNVKEIATMFVFESESTPGKDYQTLLYVDGTTSCECPGWKFKRKTTPSGDRTCRHVRDVDAGLANRHAKKVVEYATATTAQNRRMICGQSPFAIPPWARAECFCARRIIRCGFTAWTSTRP